MGKFNSKKYVSDVIDIDELISKGNNKFFIVAGVGSGKSTWVKETLTKKGNVLFITSRKAKVEEDKHFSCFNDMFNWYSEGNQTLITNAKLSKMVEHIMENKMTDLDEFIEHFDYIVVDEVHSIATDSVFAESSFGLFSFIEYVANKGRVIITMTGTPEPIETYFKDNNWEIINLLDECVYVHPSHIFITNSNNVDSIINASLKTNKVIYFVNRIDTIISTCKKILSENTQLQTEDIGAIVAKSREDDLREKLIKSFKRSGADTILSTSESTYKSIINKKLIPDECKILFSTSTLREGVDIENEDITIICDNHILSNIIQFLGRVRKGKIKVYIISDSRNHGDNNNSVLYDYACLNEVDTANAYYKNRIADSSDLDVLINKIGFIKHVMNNQYIYFDFIDNAFKVFHIRYNEELRIKGITNWKQELIDYCDKYDIEIYDFTKKSFFKEALAIMAKKEMELLSSENGVILTCLELGYGIKYKQKDLINAELKKNGAPIKIEVYKSYKKESRNKRFWKVVFDSDR